MQSYMWHNFFVSLPLCPFVVVFHTDFVFFLILLYFVQSLLLWFQIIVSTLFSSRFSMINKIALSPLLLILGIESIPLLPSTCCITEAHSHGSHPLLFWTTGDGPRAFALISAPAATANPF